MIKNDGRWSDIPTPRLPDMLSKLIEYILSISIPVVLVTLVGGEIDGNSISKVRSSKNLDVSESVL